MNKQDCLLQLGEAAREINGYRNAAHLMELQVEGYCNRIKELKARDAQLKMELQEARFVVLEELKINGNSMREQEKVILGNVLGYIGNSLALLLVEEEA